MPELLYGRRAPDSVSTGEREIDPPPTGAVTLEDVEIHYCLFEIPMAAAQARLPVSLHPSVPALIGTTCWHVPGGPLGSFDLAWTGIACRTGIKPRHFVVGAFCDSEAAGDFFRNRYGLPCRRGEVHSRETYDRVASRVAIDGEVILEVHTTRFVPLSGAGASVKYSPPLNAARVGGDPALVQFEAAYRFKRVLRGAPEALVYAAGPLGDDAIAPVFPISGTCATCDVELHPVRFRVDLEIPAETGGATKIAAST